MRLYKEIPYATHPQHPADEPRQGVGGTLSMAMILR
jgi:hypothetical protein